MARQPLTDAQFLEQRRSAPPMPRTSSSMIEQVARALCVADRHDPDGASASSCGDPYWMFYRAKARAVLTAMREPTEAMVEAANEWSPLGTVAREMFPAMIDAALAEDGR